MYSEALILDASMENILQKSCKLTVAKSCKSSVGKSGSQLETARWAEIWLTAVVDLELISTPKYSWH